MIPFFGQSGTPPTGLGAGLVSIQRLADRFSLCTGTAGNFACPHIPDFDSCATIIVIRCWPDAPEPKFFGSGEIMDSDALVAVRSETTPCGDDILITGDNRFVQIVVVDSPGVGTGGKTTRVIGERLHGIDLILPPDQILESLELVLADGVAIMIPAV